jgi:hypothetical protein
VPYVLDGTATAQTGESIYEACEGWFVTALSEKWKRPDDTIYLKAIGPGTPAGPRNVCDKTLTGTKSVAMSANTANAGTCTWMACDRQDGGGCNYVPAYNGAQYYLNVNYKEAGKYQLTNHETSESVGIGYEWTGKTSSGSVYGPTGCTDPTQMNPAPHQVFNFGTWSVSCVHDYSLPCGGTGSGTLPTGW